MPLVGSTLWLVASQWLRAPMAAALAAALTLVAISFTERVMAAGFARAAQCVFALVASLGLRTKTANHVFMAEAGIPLARLVAWGPLLVLAWQGLHGCGDGANTVPSGASCVAEMGGAHATQALAYSLLVLLAAVDGISMGWGAELEVGAGGLAVAASLLSFEVTDADIDAARIGWDRAVFIAAVLMPAVAFGGYAAQHAAFVGPTSLSFVGAGTRGTAGPVIALTAAPVLFLAAIFTVSGLASAACVFVLRRRYNAERDVLEQRLVTADANRERTRSVFRMSRADAIPDTDCDDTPIRQPGVYTGGAGDDDAAVARRLDARDTSAGFVNGDRMTFGPDDDDDEFRGDSRLYSSMQAIIVSDPRLGGGSRGSGAAGSAPRSPAAMPQRASGGPNGSHRSAASSNTQAAAVPVLDDSSEEDADGNPRSPAHRSSRTLPHGVDDDDDDDEDGLYARPDGADGDDARRTRRCLCCPHPLRRLARRVARHTVNGVRQLRDQPHVAGVIATSALEIGLESALTAIVVPVCCITLPFLGGPSSIESSFGLATAAPPPSSGTDATTGAPHGSHPASVVGWERGLGAGLLWTTCFLLLARVMTWIGDNVGRWALRSHLDAPGLSPRADADDGDGDGQASFRAMERPAVMRILVVGLGFVAPCGFGIADQLYRNGSLCRWGAAGLFAASLCACSLALGLAHATTVALQREACVALPNPRSVFAAIVAIVHFADAVLSVVAAVVLDDGSDTIAVLFGTPRTPDASERQGLQFAERLWGVVGGVVGLALVDMVLSALLLYRRHALERKDLDVSLYGDQFAVPGSRGFGAGAGMSRRQSSLSDCTAAGANPAIAAAMAATPRAYGNPYSPYSGGGYSGYDSPTYGRPSRSPRLSARRQASSRGYSPPNDVYLPPNPGRMASPPQVLDLADD